MALTKSSEKRRAVASGQEFRTFEDGSSVASQGVALVDESGDHLESGRGGIASAQLAATLALGATIGGTSDEIWLIAAGIGGTANVRGSLKIREIRG